MKSSSLILASTSGLLAAAHPHLRPRDGVSDTANEMNDAIEGNGSCADLGVIFARGTFDSGNVGVWVGPQFLSAVKDNVESVAIQGVDPEAYAADLSGYLEDNGGSSEGASSLASTVAAYVEKCPDSKVVVSGWSQGAVVAHKGLAQISSPAINNVIGLVTFGDPNAIWENITLPATVPSSSFNSVCDTEQPSDPLCDVDAPLVELPTAKSIIDDMKNLPDVAVGAQEVEAAASLVAAFPGQLIDAWDGFVGNLNPQQFRRLMLTPSHFNYGNNGMAADAGAWVGELMSSQ